MKQSRIEETHALQEFVPANPVCFVKETIPAGQRKWVDIPNKWHQEDALSTEISKLVMRLGRHSDQDEREVDGAVHWDSMKPRLRNAFLMYGSSEFSGLEVTEQNVRIGLSTEGTRHRVRRTTTHRPARHDVPPPCLGGAFTRVGPGQHPRYTRADFGLEAVGGSTTTTRTRRQHADVRHEVRATRVQTTETW